MASRDEQEIAAARLDFTPWRGRWTFHETGGVNKPDRIEPKPYYRCPHCSRGLDERHLTDPDARFLDCIDCSTTWDVTGLAEPEAGTDHWDGLTSQQRYDAFIAGVGS